MQNRQNLYIYKWMCIENAVLCTYQEKQVSFSWGLSMLRGQVTFATPSRES